MPSDIIVMNIRDRVPQGYTPIKITRPHVFGNPFYLKDVHNDQLRESCIADFKKYLWREMQNPKSPVLQTLQECARSTEDIAWFATASRGHAMAMW